jgi:cell division protein FtsX
MASKTLEHDPNHPALADPPHCGDLLEQLEQGFRPLPTRTVLAMALGSLRVRMLRSSVTTLSVILAIALLAYTGLSGMLARNVALELRRLESQPSMDAQRLADATSVAAASDLLGGLPVAGRRTLAKRLQMQRVEPQKAALNEANDGRRRLDGEIELAKSSLAAIQSDQDADAAERAAAGEKVEWLEQQRADLDATRAALEERIGIGTWLRSADEQPQMVEAINTLLRERQQSLLRGLARAGQLEEKQLEHVAAFVDLAANKLAAADHRTLREALEVEHAKRGASALRRLLRRNGVSVEATLAGNPLDTWLIVMALLTCAVGIANAMLMSVTERIREIGTMKCLGAQDGLVIRLFLLESALLGIVGGAVGVVVGVVVALLAGTLQFGGTALTQFPFVAGWRIPILSLLCGMALSVCGALYPAITASRMRPVDALRVDE